MYEIYLNLLIIQIKLIIIQLMRESQIKLSEMISQKQMSSKKKGPEHAVYNSLKRNTIYSSASKQDQESSYQCRLPETNFSRKDLSIVLRYLLYKQEMKISDRNLLRRILLNNFQEELVIAGSKKFVEFLKLLQGQNTLNRQLLKENLFYFVLKGKARITSCGLTYEAYPGNTFGQIQILSQQKIQSVVFQSNFILLTLDKDHFNTFFRRYYVHKYESMIKEVCSIEQQFLNKVPLINKYMFVNKIKYRTFSSGDKIVTEGEKLQNIYFLPEKWKEDNQVHILFRSLGISQLLKRKQAYNQTVYCLNRLMSIPYVHKDIFIFYILSSLQIQIMPAILESFKNVKNGSLLDVDPKQRMKKFMKIKKVKLLLNKERLKTEHKEEVENSFIFFRQNTIARLPIRQRYKSIRSQKQKQPQKQPKITNFSDLIKQTILQFNSLKKL